MIYITKSPEETINIAKEYAKRMLGGEIILLDGDLGAGKTTFAKGLAQGLEITDIVVSPTFTIMNEYKGRLNMYHYDMYRIQSADELIELGLEEYLYSDGVSVIEWNKFDLISYDKVIRVAIRTIDDNTRRIEIK